MWHKGLKIICIAMALVLASCGGENKTTDNSFSFPSGGSVDGGNVGSRGDVGVIFEGIKAQAPGCKSGGARIDAHFTGGTPIYGNVNKVAFNTVSATSLSGSVNDFYIGLSAWYDLMIVYKMPGNQFGVSLSMCQFGSTITPNRAISKFSAPYGIVLAQYTTGGMGSIVAAQNTYIQVENPQKGFGPTTFFPVTVK